MNGERSGSQTIVRTAVAFEGGLVALAVALGWLIGQPPLERVYWTGGAVGRGLLSSLPLLAAMWLMVRFPVGPLRSLIQVTREQIIPLFIPSTAAQIALIALLAGFGEELLFRGVLQAAISQKAGSDAVGLLLAGVLFGALHSITPTYALLTGLVGIYFGWLFVVSQNLLVPITAHAAYDFVALVYLIRRQQRETSCAGGGE